MSFVRVYKLLEDIRNTREESVRIQKVKDAVRDNQDFYNTIYYSSNPMYSLSCIAAGKRLPTRESSATPDEFWEYVKVTLSRVRDENRRITIEESTEILNMCNWDEESLHIGRLILKGSPCIRLLPRKIASIMRFKINDFMVPSSATMRAISNSNLRKYVWRPQVSTAREKIIINEGMVVVLDRKLRRRERIKFTTDLLILADRIAEYGKLSFPIELDCYYYRGDDSCNVDDIMGLPNMPLWKRLYVLKQAFKDQNFKDLYPIPHEFVKDRETMEAAVKEHGIILIKELDSIYKKGITREWFLIGQDLKWGRKSSANLAVQLDIF